MLALVERIIKDDLSSREVEGILKTFTDPKPRKRKEMSRQYKIYSSSGAQLGTIKESDSGKISFVIQLDDIKERESFLNELKKRFNLNK